MKTGSRGAGVEEAEAAAAADWNEAEETTALTGRRSGSGCDGANAESKVDEEASVEESF